MITSSLVEQRCQNFLNLFKETYNKGIRRSLRRGLLINPEGDFTRLAVSKNRKPVNTHIVIHKLTDDWFKMKFGIRARSEGFFCTSKESVAKDYGFPFLVFPEGEFDVIHSNKIDDLFINLDMFTIQREYIKHYGESQVSRLENRKDLEKFFLEDIDIEKLRPVIYSLMEGFDYRLNDYAAALVTGNEIMVICDHYFASPTNNEKALTLLKSQIM